MDLVYCSCQECKFNNGRDGCEAILINLDWEGVCTSFESTESEADE